VTEATSDVNVVPPRAPSSVGQPRPPVAAPVATQWTAVRPLATDDVHIGANFWHERLLINDATSLATLRLRLEESGNFDNLRIAAGLTSGEFRGRAFADSDVYKWLEAVSWTLQRVASEQWDGVVDDVIELLAKAQESDGYLNSHIQVTGLERWSDLAMGHELYCAGHLFQAAVAHHRATGKTTLLSVAERFAALIVEEFGENGRRVGYCGHPEVETALIELYRETGRRDYLDVAARMINLRGSRMLGEEPFGRAYFQDERPIRSTTEARGHAVRFLYLAAGTADLYLETGEAVLLERLVEQWSDMVDGKTYITGGVGSRHRDEAFGDRYELPSDRAYTETCAAVASLQWAWRMVLATGHPRYAEMFERTLYNGFLSGVSLDGTRFFYVNPLHRRADGTSGPPTRQEWYECACCPPNIVRLLAAFPHYLFTRDDSGLQIHQYATASARTELVGGQQVGCDISTRYPLEGQVEITIPADRAGIWTLSLRIPDWAAGARLHVNGDERAAPVGTYVQVSRQWRGGERIVLELPMPPRLTSADPRIDALRGAVAIERGPLVYCFEGLDQDVDIETVSIVGDPAAGEPHLQLPGIPTVGIDGIKRQTAGAGLPYHASAQLGPTDTTDVRLTAIPYFAWANRDPTSMRVWLAHDAGPEAST
jgi:DUF1680 family protein